MLTSRGPFALWFVGLSVVTSLIAIAALAFTIASVFGRVNTIQDARQQSAVDTCQLLDLLILKSGAAVHKTAQSKAFIMKIGLADCEKYGRRIRNGQKALHLPPIRH